MERKRSAKAEVTKPNNGAAKPQPRKQSKKHVQGKYANYNGRFHQVGTVTGGYLSYRENDDDSAQRRYYIGGFQIGYARQEGKGWKAFPCGPDHDAIQGVPLQSEKELHDWFRAEVLK
jgi:hypothetical protein